MDTLVVNLATTVQKVVEDYAEGYWAKASGYAVSDTVHQVYTVLAVPDYPRKFRAGIVVLARVAGDTVYIEEDITDRPLVHELVRAGIPREKIVCVYLGEGDKIETTSK